MNNMTKVSFPYRATTHLAFLHVVGQSGSWAKHGSEIGETEAKGEKGEKEASERHFKVSKVDMVAETCALPKAATTKTK